MIFVIAIALCGGTWLTAALAHLRLERAIAAQCAADAWHMPIGGYWRNDQRLRAIRQRLGVFGRVPVLNRRLMRIATEFLP